MSRIVIITCNGLDGACAAAMALLTHPKAELIVTSAAGVAYSLDLLAATKPAPSEVHVCGVGVGCEMRELQAACRALRKAGADVFWHCGRGYLDASASQMTKFCRPVFVKAASNTEAVSRHFALEANERAQFLCGLALHDRALDPPKRYHDDIEGFWADFLNGSALQYFKYMDREAYSEAIRKLAANQADEKARRIADIYRQSGAKYLLTGSSKAMARLKERIRKCADADAPVLILGESGVGKEFIAHLVHERSARSTEAFVPVNCACFAGNLGLADSELFGHRKGAFTGANEDRKGKLVEANGGILFLDELGELPLEVQAKLLRVIEDGSITPVGADRPTARIDVRVLAATNRNLAEMVNQGRFRQDLFYRLNTLRIEAPPLRDHIEDLPAIAAKTLAELAPPYAGRKLSSEDLRLLAGYDWPGNVRQLIQTLKRWAYLKEPLNDLIEEERRCADFGRQAATANPLCPLSPGQVQPLEEVRRQYAQRALELYGGNNAATARALKIAVNTLKSLIR